jgi:hypothetical protein
MPFFKLGSLGSLLSLVEEVDPALLLGRGGNGGALCVLPRRPDMSIPGPAGLPVRTESGLFQGTRSMPFFKLGSLGSLLSLVEEVDPALLLGRGGNGGALCVLPRRPDMSIPGPAGLPAGELASSVACTKEGDNFRSSAIFPTSSPPCPLASICRVRLSGESVVLGLEKYRSLIVVPELLP